jgi:putative ABC transport system permease protein
MNALSIALRSLGTRKLNSFLCIAAAGAGIALLCAVLLLSEAIQEGMGRNARGIDLVVGAKSSPLLLILSTVYHSEAPAGNIEEKDAEPVTVLPRVEKAIPVLIGDNYKGMRLIGTTPDFLALYGAQFADGKVFAKQFEAVAGAQTGLEVGGKIASVYGLSADSESILKYRPYKITGILKPTGTVIDRMIVTSVASMQEQHRHPNRRDLHAEQSMRIGSQITALLLKAESPAAVRNLPQEINQIPGLMAASPSQEIGKFFQTMGFGRDVLIAVGSGFIVLSAIVLFSTLAAGLSARRYDLGVMRVLGASPEHLFTTVMAEALVIGTTGTLLGLVAGHALAWQAAEKIPSLQGFIAPEVFLHAGPLDGRLFLLGLGASLLTALVPAISAARTDITGLLARGRA